MRFWSWLRKRVPPSQDVSVVVAGSGHVHAQMRILHKQVASLQRQVSDHDQLLHTRGRKRGVDYGPGVGKVVQLPLSAAGHRKRPGVS